MSYKDEVLRYLGYRGQELDDLVSLQIDKNIELAEKKLKPLFMYRIFDIKATDKIYLEGTNISFCGKDIYNHLKEAEKCVVLAATLGVESERILNYLAKTKLSEAVVFDAVCTAKIEQVCDICEDEIKAWAKQHEYYTNYRYSPGYGDFPLEYQRQITLILGCEKRIGLTVTESSLLIPQKSVTAVMGLFKEEQKKKTKNCETCNLKDRCVFRKNGKECGGENSEKFCR